MGYYKPTLQTKFGKDGNCLCACLATLFDVSIKDIPNFADSGKNWAKACSRWLKENFGKFAVEIQLHDLKHTEAFCDSFVIMTLDTKKPEVTEFRHAVITKGANIIFDPLKGEVEIPISEKINPVFLIICDVMEG